MLNDQTFVFLYVQIHLNYTNSANSIVGFSAKSHLHKGSYLQYHSIVIEVKRYNSIIIMSQVVNLALRCNIQLWVISLF